MTDFLKAMVSLERITKVLSYTDCEDDIETIREALQQPKAVDVETIKHEALKAYGGNGIVKRSELEGMEWLIEWLHQQDHLSPIPDGYVLVPIEPTDEMIQAAYDIPSNLESWEDEYREEYKAMIQAAKGGACD